MGKCKSALLSNIDDISMSSNLSFLQRSLKFPKARFFCRLCEYHCDTVEICRRHVRDARHMRLKQTQEEDMLLKNLPPPSAPHLAALTKVLDGIYSCQGLTDDEVKHREATVKKLEMKLQTKIPGKSLLCVMVFHKAHSDFFSYFYNKHFPACIVMYFCTGRDLFMGIHIPDHVKLHCTENVTINAS